MRTHRVLLGMLCLMFLGSCLAVVQAQTGVTLPKVLWVYREDVKPARSAIHQRVEQGFAQLWAKAQAKPFLGLDSVTGNANETIFLSGYGSFEDLEKDFLTLATAMSGPTKQEYEGLAKQEAELVNSARSIVAVYREDLSYRMDPALPGLPKARYMQIATVRIRLGKDEEFGAGLKLIRSGYEKLNGGSPWAVYQVVSGAPQGTYLFLSAMRSLKEIDADMAMEPKLMEALGAETLKSIMKGMNEIFVSMENNIYAFSPRISHVPKTFSDVDPEFWAPKPKPSEKPAAEPKKP